MPAKKSFEDLSLAEKISDILNDPKLPPMMLEGFQQALTDTFNDSSFNQDAIMAWERGPQYINYLIQGSGKGRGRASA